MPSDPLFYLVGWATILLISIGKSAFGGGLAILGIPLMAMVTNPLDASIMIALLLCLMDLLAMGRFGVSTWSRPDLAWLVPGLVLGIGIGYVVFTRVDGRLVTLMIGVTTLAFTAHWFLKGRLATGAARPVVPGLALLAGTVSGFTTFVAHAGGPPVAMYLLSRKMPKTVLVGTTVALFTLGNWLKAPPYVLLGLKQPGVLWSALALAPAVPVGIWLGRLVHDRLEQKALFVWCYGLLAVAAAKLTVDSGLALLR